MDQDSSYRTAERIEKYGHDQYADMNTNQPSACNDNPRPDTEVKLTLPAAVNSKPRDDSPLHLKPVHSQCERQHSSPHSPTPIEATSTLRRLLDNTKKQCPFHKKPQPMQGCRAFREKPLEERKAFLGENGICFHCCSSTSHQAKNCKAVIQCFECNSDKHVAALHAGPAPWSMKQGISPSEQHSREEEESPSSSITTSTCIEICGDSTAGKSCTKICPVYVYPKGQPEKKARAFAILDNKSNGSLTRSAVSKIYNIADGTSPYTLRTCAGVSETVGQTARGFIVESADEKTSLSLPTLDECDQLSHNRAEIPTPAAARYQGRDFASLGKRHHPSAQGPRVM